MAYLMPALLVSVGTAAYFLLFPGDFQPLGSSYAAAIGITNSGEYTKQLLLMVPLAILVNPFGGLLGALGEEFAWRGYLLSKLCERMPVWKAVLLTNLIWGLWHAPIIAMGYNYGTGHPVGGVLMMCFFCIVIGCLLSFLFLKTQSVWVPALGHAALNAFDKCAPSILLTTGAVNSFVGPDPVGIIGGIGFTLLAAFCYWIFWKHRKAPLAIGSAFDGIATKK